MTDEALRLLGESIKGRPGDWRPSAPRWGASAYPDASDMAVTNSLWMISIRLFLDPGLARCALLIRRPYPLAPQRDLDRVYHRLWIAPGVDYDWR